jgi:hypothetical protein
VKVEIISGFEVWGTLSNLCVKLGRDWGRREGKTLSRRGTRVLVGSTTGWGARKS